MSQYLVQSGIKEKDARVFFEQVISTRREISGADDSARTPRGKKITGSESFSLVYRNKKFKN
jgi:hypothetical protein